MKRPCAFVKAVLTVLVALTVMFLWPIAVALGGIGLAIWVLYGLFLHESTQKPSDDG